MSAHSKLLDVDSFKCTKWSTFKCIHYRLKGCSILPKDISFHYGLFDHRSMFYYMKIYSPKQELYNVCTKQFIPKKVPISSFFSVVGLWPTYNIISCKSWSYFSRKWKKLSRTPINFNSKQLLLVCFSWYLTGLAVWLWEPHRELL